MATLARIERLINPAGRQTGAAGVRRLTQRERERIDRLPHVSAYLRDLGYGEQGVQTTPSARTVSVWLLGDAERGRRVYRVQTDALAPVLRLGNLVRVDLAIPPISGADLAVGAVGAGWLAGSAHALAAAGATDVAQITRVFWPTGTPRPTAEQAV